MRIHFLRHATLVLTIHNLTFLVDPMLSPLEAMEPVANAGNQWGDSHVLDSAKHYRDYLSHSPYMSSMDLL